MDASKNHPAEGHVASNPIVEVLQGEGMTTHGDDVALGFAT
ncbi:hypothetical protein [Lysobacter brunescens]